MERSSWEQLALQVVCTKTPCELNDSNSSKVTSNITGYAVYQGLSTSLDTLCAQAYGSGRKKLVGLQLQRMVLFLWVITIPISIIWLFGTRILKAIVPNQETAEYAGLYLKVLIFGAPGYAAFESGKRFVQAQGMFSVTLYILLICAPLNAIMNYVFVWVSIVGASSLLLANGCVAIWLGLYWGPYCSRNNRQSAPNLPRSICLLY